MNECWDFFVCKDMEMMFNCLVLESGLLYKYIIEGLDDMLG